MSDVKMLFLNNLAQDSPHFIGSVQLHVLMKYVPSFSKKIEKKMIIKY